MDNLDELARFTQDFEHMLHRAERNARLFGGVSWQAHIETLRPEDLPELESKLPLIEANMKLFASDPEEMDKLEDLKEFTIRQIAHIKALQDKENLKKKKK